MKQIGMGYWILGTAGRPTLAKETNEFGNLDHECHDNYLCLGTGVIDTYQTYNVAIRYKAENCSKVSSTEFLTWHVEICAQSVENAKKLAVRDFRVIEGFTIGSPRRKIISVTIFAE